MADKPWRVSLGIDELHLYVHESRHGLSVPTSAEQVTRWRKVMADFAAVQDEMQAAYEKAERAEQEACRVKAAEDAVAEAQARLDGLRWEQEHLPYDPATWPAPGDFSCTGPSYDSSKDANVGRIGVYDRTQQLGARMRFDVAPYTCVEGHWHLGRTV